MKILAVNGSPRGERGNTFIMVEEFLKGARKLGAQTEHILLSKKNIKHCIGCFACWVKTPGTCVIKDDMSELLPKLDVDILIFATPLYVDNVSGLMKNFMDRMIPVASPYFEKDENGESVHRFENHSKPKIVVISNCGFPEQTHFQVLELLFKRVARNMHSKVIAEIYRGEGEMLKNKSFLLKPILHRYKKLLRRAGEEVVNNGEISEKLKLDLEKPLVPYDRYIKGANDHWDKLLKERN